MGGPDDNYAKGQALERQIADLFTRNGYEAELNVVRNGRSGAPHEIDVLARRSDQLTATSTLLECKAWSEPISKEVVAKTSLVMRDVGVNHAIVVALDGWTTGAADTAREVGVELWGPDELAERLGHHALSGLRSAPVVEAQGFECTVEPAQAEQLIRKEAGGILGLGRKRVASFGLLWIPWHLLQLGISYEKRGFRTRTVSRRVWNMYDALDGSSLFQFSSSPVTAPVDISSGSLGIELKVRKLISTITTSLTKHGEVTTEAAKERYAGRLASLGIDLPASAIQVEEQATVYLPIFAAIIQERDGERVAAVHANDRAEIDAMIGAALTGRLASVADALGS